MSPFMAVLVAVKALQRNAMRTVLTALGLIIGVAAVIVMVALGSGAKATIESQIRSAGSNLLIVTAGSTGFGPVRQGQGATTTLTPADAQAIREELPGIRYLSPGVSTRTQVASEASNWGTQVQGAGEELSDLRSWPLEHGVFLSREDVVRAGNVAVLGSVVRDQLFGPGTDPTGALIRIKGAPFRVIGVLTSKGQAAMGQDQDDVIIMPISTAKKKVLGSNQASSNSVGSIMVQARAPEQMSAAEQQVRTLLRQRHRLQQGQDDDFTVRNLEEVFAAQETSARVMSILLAAIASVSLIVGGIGIMNIMLVSVTERTKEIGLRQAVGAKTKDILSQFLVEAVTLSILGGIIGIILGATTSMLISHFAEWNTQISPGAVALAFLFSGFVGIFFGYYPARKAAFLDPIEALRYE